MGKFSIFRTIDYEYLDKQIYNYINSHRENPYIFMSEKTLRILIPSWIEENYTVMGEVIEYEGMKVYINDSLDEGVVELR